VLTRKEEAPVEQIKETVSSSTIPEVKPRPTVLQGSTYETETPVGKAYITINTNGGNQPVELFINVGKAGSDVTAMAEGLGKLISLTLRMSSPIPPIERAQKIANMLIGIGGARSLGFGVNRIRSLPDAVAKVIEKHFGFFQQHRLDQVSQPAERVPAQGNRENEEHDVAKLLEKIEASSKKPLAIEEQQSRMVTVDLCPKCGEGSLVFEEACKKCYSCGYSEC
jgi:ribonucleoside-diphosphate reductase alpha chain